MSKKKNKLYINIINTIRTKFFKEIFFPFMARVVHTPSMRVGVGLHLGWELHPLPSAGSENQIWIGSHPIRV
jgi:hypothetical protein